MHRSPCLAAAALVLAAAVSTPLAETTRTLKMELKPDAHGLFAVENLAGVMHVIRGTGDTVVVVATVHAEDPEAADAMQFLQVTGEKGAPTLRLRYPLERYGTIRYPGARREGSSDSLLAGLFGGSSTTARYDDRKVKVSTSSGTLLYADVEVQVPGREIEAIFRNLVGKLEADGIEGKIKLDTSSGDVIVARSRGSILADTGSGDVRASEIGGSFKCDTGSGECTLIGFEGEKVECDVGSGDITVKSASARLITADSGSGDIHVEDSDAEEFRADTGSGDVELQARGSRLQRVKADTGSGDVRLRLDPGATFEARADQGSGDIVNHFKDAEPIVKNRTVVGYRRGDGRIRIDVDTGSGDLVLEPSR